MKPLALKLVPIGNSRGVRLPAAWIARYHLAETVLVEPGPSGLLLRPMPETAPLSWEATARAMAAARDDDFSDLDATLADGLAHLDA